MKAARIHAHGGPDMLTYEDADVPTPGPGEVLIRVAVAGVNPADYKHCSGMFKDIVPYQFPYTPGYDVSGTIVAVGKGVTSPSVGTRVFALLDSLRAGGYAEFVATRVSRCAVMPSGLDFETAASIPCPALTAAQMVEGVLRPAPGDTVLVTGATGMVGRFAVRALEAMHARVVVAVRPAYVDEARALGADEVIALDGSGWQGVPFDGVIDTVGGAVATALVRHVKPGGRILCAATDPLDMTQLPTAPEFIAVQPDAARLEQWAQDVASGVVSIQIAARFPLAEAGRAQALVERGGMRGKVVLIVDATS